MGLAEMITESSRRKQELIERPANLLKANEDFRNSQAIKVEDVASSQARTEDTATRTALLGKADERAEAAEGRAAEAFPLDKKGKQLDNTSKEYAIESQKMQQTKQRQVASEGAPQQNVDQAIQLNKIYLETGDPSAKAQRDIILQSIAEDDNIKGLLAYNIPYGDMAKLDKGMLFNPNDTDGSHTEEQIQIMLGGMQRNMKAYQIVLQNQANQTAAKVLSASRAEAEGKALGEVVGTAKGFAENEAAGRENPVEPLTEGQQSRVQSNFGNYLGEVMDDIGKDAGFWANNINLDSKGEFQKQVSKMPGAMYNAEVDFFVNSLRVLGADATKKAKPKGVSDKEFTSQLIDSAIAKGRADGIYPEESPFYRKLLEMKGIKSKHFNNALPTD